MRLYSTTRRISNIISEYTLLEWKKETVVPTSQPNANPRMDTPLSRLEVRSGTASILALFCRLIQQHTTLPALFPLPARVFGTSISCGFAFQLDLSPPLVIARSPNGIMFCYERVQLVCFTGHDQVFQTPVRRKATLLFQKNYTPRTYSLR